AFLFKYSPREGTRAFRWGDPVSADEKARRLQRLISLQESISAEINRALVGEAVEGLVEGPAGRPAGRVAGRRPERKAGGLAGPARPGELVRGRVETSTSHSLTGVALRG